MRRLYTAFLACLALVLLVPLAHGQGVNRVCVESAGQQGTLSCTDVAATNPFPVAPANLPLGATAITGNGTGTTGAVVGTLTAKAGVTNYLCTLDVSALGGTATIAPITVAGLLGGSFTYQLASTATGNTLSRTFTPCVPASAVNTAITATTSADGTASGVDVNLSGFQQ